MNPVLLIALIAFSLCVRAQDFSADSSSIALAKEADLARRTIERRAVEAVIWGMPAVNFDLMYQAMVRAKGAGNQIVYWSSLLSWKNQTLTPNPDTIYFMPFFNTKDVGPVVLEIPPAEGGSITGSVMDGGRPRSRTSDRPVSTRAAAANTSSSRLATRRSARRLHRDAVGQLHGLRAAALHPPRPAATPAWRRPSPTPSG